MEVKELYHIKASSIFADLQLPKTQMVIWTPTGLNISPRTILNECTTFRNQIMCVHFIILHRTTSFGLQAGHHQVLSDNIIKRSSY
jgi:hypothetical protein